MNGLEEVQVKNYPNNWNQLKVRKEFKYDKNIPVSELKPLLASEIEPWFFYHLDRSEVSLQVSIMAKDPQTSGH